MSSPVIRRPRAIHQLHDIDLACPGVAGEKAGVDDYPVNDSGKPESNDRPIVTRCAAAALYPVIPCLGLCSPSPLGTTALIRFSFGAKSSFAAITSPPSRSAARSEGQ
jgi:hypothetical protein